MVFISNDIKIIYEILNNYGRKEDIVLDNIRNKRNSFNTYSPIYPYTNDYLLDYSYNKEKVLTVCASLDQALMCILKGANKVRMYDINALTKYYFGLKLCALKVLSYDEYIKNKDNLIIDKVLKCLNYEDYEFWNMVKSYDYSILFNNLYDFSYFPLRYKDDYNLCKKNINNVEFLPFIECDIFNLKNKIKDEKYDYIITSNISSYFNGEEIKAYLKLIDDLKENLNDGGIIQLGHYVKNPIINNNRILLRGDLSFNKLFNYIKDDEKYYIKDTKDSITCFVKKK